MTTYNFKRLKQIVPTLDIRQLCKLRKSIMRLCANDKIDSLQFHRMYQIINESLISKKLDQI